MSNIEEEIIDLDENIDFHQKNEDSEEYVLNATFDNKKLAKIEKLQLKKMHPSTIMSTLRGLYRRQKVVIHEYQEIERSIDITQVKGNIKLNLLTQESIHDILRKIPKQKRDKIQYVYLAGIQILFKSLFKEGIDSPIVISLFDERFKQIKDAHLGTIEGNLAYRKLLFTCYPRYCISLKDKDFNDALSLHFELLKKDLLKPGNKVMSVYYSALFSLSNTNYGEIYSNKPFIEIKEECQEISKVREPLLQNISIPDNYKIGFNNARALEIGSSSQTDIPMEYKNNCVVVSKGRSSFDLPKRKQQQLQRSRSYINIKRNAPTLKIYGEYFNGLEYIKGPYVLIDTGASNNHLAQDKNLNLRSENVPPYEYRNFDGTTSFCTESADVSIRLGTKDLIVPCYVDNEMSGGAYHVLLGNSFLDSFDEYKITKEGFEFVLDGERIFCQKYTGE